MTGPASRWWRTLLALVLLTVGTSSLTAAQGTTASITGIISDNNGVLPGASIVAKDTQSGFTYEAVSDAQGAFNLSGLRPGTYEITVSMAQYKPQSKAVQVLLGQKLTSNFRIGPDVIYAESVEVVASSRLIETRTSEVSTSVTPEQVRYLPQNQRNFLNFAALAPGARVSDDETRKQVTGGGLDATQVNVFIDGVRRSTTRASISAWRRFFPSPNGRRRRSPSKDSTSSTRPTSDATTATSPCFRASPRPSARPHARWTTAVVGFSWD